MTTRAEFLAVVADRLRSGLPENPLRPIALTPNPPIAYHLDDRDRIERFEEAASGVGAEILESDELESLLQHVVGDVSPTRAVVAEHRLSGRIVEALAALGVEVIDAADPAAVADADLGITATVAGVALTGSIVIDSSIPGSRLASLLPDIHLALVDKNSIVDTPGDIWRGLSRSTLPSNLVFITGPSRSADIELKLTVGVHGPRRLLIALV